MISPIYPLLPRAAETANQAMRPRMSSAATIAIAVFMSGPKVGELTVKLDGGRCVCLKCLFRTIKPSKILGFPVSSNVRQPFPPRFAPTNPFEPSRIDPTGPAIAPILGLVTNSQIVAAIVEFVSVPMINAPCVSIFKAHNHPMHT